MEKRELEEQSLVRAVQLLYETVKERKLKEISYQFKNIKEHGKTERVQTQ